MASVKTRSQPEAFDQGRVVRRAIAVIRENWLVCGLAAIVFITLPRELYQWTLNPGTISHAKLITGVSLIVFVPITSALSAYTQFFVFGLFKDPNLEPSVGMIAPFRPVASRAWPLACTAVVANLGMFAGFLLLVVPGVILGVAWIVAGPVVGQEGCGVRRALRRSADLTKGHRGPILGLVVIWFVVLTVTEVLAVKVASGGVKIPAATHVPIVAFLVLPAIATVFDFLASATVASIYVELLTINEGGMRSAVANVFD